MSDAPAHLKKAAMSEMEEAMRKLAVWSNGGMLILCKYICNAFIYVSVYEFCVCIHVMYVYTYICIYVLRQCVSCIYVARLCVSSLSGLVEVY
jgi:hypothetical protein